MKAGTGQRKADTLRTRHAPAPGAPLGIMNRAVEVPAR